MNNSDTKKFICQLIEAEDGSGDVILQFPEELIQEMGWQEGTEIDFRVENRPSGNVIIMTKVEK